MDKLLKSNWFVKLISFLIALMLYTVVATEEPMNPLGLGSDTEDVTNEPSRLENVELVAYYNEDQYMVTGLPKTVTVQLQGPPGLITKAYLANDYEVFVDLRGKGPGIQEVPVQTKGFPSGLAVSTFPQQVTVTIREKQTKVFPIRIDLIHENEVPEGYQIGEPIMDPDRVKITAAKKVINRIAFVKGIVDVAGAKDTVEETVPLNVYDKNGNELNVQLSTSVVEVKVPIAGPSKTVPVQVVRKGSLPDGLSVQSIDLNRHEVTLFAPRDVLDEIEYVEVPLNLDHIKNDKTVELEVPPPENVNKIAPEKVEVFVDVAKEVTKTLPNAGIEVLGSSDGLTVEFLEPEDRLVDVILTGTKEALKNIEISDIDVYIDVGGLSTGKHSVQIEVDSLPNNVEAEPAIEQAKIEITESETSNENNG